MKSSDSFCLKEIISQSTLSANSRMKSSESFGMREYLFQGSRWHWDGDLGFNILSTGVFILEADNLAPLDLGFVQTTEQNRTTVNRLEGVGRVRCHPGRCIVFPQYYVHKMSTLRLVNSQNPGRLRTLIIHVLDPTRPTLSTAEILPQQHSWIFDSVKTLIALIAEAYSLPMDVQELLEAMLSDVGWSLCYARALREKRKTKNCWH